MNTNQVQNKTVETEIKGVSFNTTASVDTKGVVRLHSEIRNKNVFDKHQLTVTLRLVNDGNVVYQLTSDAFPIYGTFVSLFIPNKKCSTVLNRYGNLSFENLVMQDPNAFTTDPQVNKLDEDIKELATTIRRTKVLVDAQEEGQSDITKEFEDLVEKMTALKDERMKRLHDIETNGKFDAITIEIDHIVE
jgi:hypothetical protein